MRAIPHSLRILAVVLAAAAVLPQGANAAETGGRKKPKPQTVEGQIAMSAPYTDGSCFFGLHRRINLVAQRAVQGVVGYDFDVDPATVGRKFKIEPEGSGIDLDISFYMGMGDMQDPGGAPANVDYATREEGGESGVIPKGYPIAIVCMVTGTGASFTYTGGL